MGSQSISNSKAAFFHLIGSVLVVGSVVMICYFLWFPYPYNRMVAGMGLPGLVALVDIVCGPFLTFVVYKANKSRRERVFDGLVIFVVQSLALIYGISVMAGARPIYVVFEVDRFRVVAVNDVDQEQWGQAPEELRHPQWNGPKIIGVRPPRDAEELLDSVNLSLSGQEPSLRPGWWQLFDLNKNDVLKKARSISDLTKARPEAIDLISEEVQRIQAKYGVISDDILWLPLVSSKSAEWIIFLEKFNLKPVGYLPVDGFL